MSVPVCGNVISWAEPSDCLSLLPDCGLGVAMMEGENHAGQSLPWPLVSGNCHSHGQNKEKTQLPKAWGHCAHGFQRVPWVLIMRKRIFVLHPPHAKHTLSWGSHTCPQA